ncbi:MAG: GT2 family glycosyltransferase [Halieaceae bacterium]|jgi:GT2 family glycosyltransferase
MWVMPEVGQSMINVGVVILNWRKSLHTIRCVESLLLARSEAGSAAKVRIVLVDNDSQGYDVEALTSWLQESGAADCHLICSNENLGFAGGMNLGIRFLESSKPDHYWLLNNDLVVEPGSVDSLVFSAKAFPDIAIWGPTVVDATTNLVQCAGGCRYYPCIGMDKSAYSGLPLNEVLNKPEGKFDYIYGAAMLVKGDFLRKSGGLDERYFLYFEELELASKLDSKQRLSWCKNAVVRHVGSSSISNDKDYRARTSYHAALSAYRFTWNHYPICLPTVVVFRILGLAFRALVERNSRLALAPVRALLHFSGVSARIDL